MTIKSYGLNNIFVNIDSCAVNIIPNDTTIYSNNPVQIQLNITPEADSVKWTPSIGLNNNAISNPIATINNSTQYIVEAYYYDTNLVYNGDFELGNVGFTTDLLLTSQSSSPYGTYIIANDAHTLYWGFTSCTHNGGLFMSADGAPNLLTTYESQVNVEPNTDYIFSVEFANINESPYFVDSWRSIFQLKINGVSLGSQIINTSDFCIWNRYYRIWNSGNNTTATVNITNLNISPDGNDFALDNVSLRKICKATDTINIIFAPQTIIDTIDITICENDLPYNYNDSTFTQSGTYFYNFSINNIIDSTYLIHLYVLEPYINTINATICEGETYAENGFNQNTTGLYTQELQSINGCDSTIILDLEVKQAYNTTINASICEGDTYNQNGFNENTTGSYTNTYNSYNGCDSTITLQLQVNNTRDTVIYDTIYSGTAYTNFGFYRTEEGTYFNTYQIGQGCPMNITLYLTVKEVPQVNVWLPNTITPYDVVNTEFGYYTELQYLESVKFEVYNRWGNRIFESVKIGEYWDGTYKGKECQRGLYAWKLKYKTIFEDKYYEKSGNVHLIW